MEEQQAAYQAIMLATKKEQEKLAKTKKASKATEEQWAIAEEALDEALTHRAEALEAVGETQEEREYAIEELEKTEVASTIAAERLEEAETDLAKVSEAITATIAEAKRQLPKPNKTCPDCNSSTKEQCAECKRPENTKPAQKQNQEVGDTEKKAHKRNSSEQQRIGAKRSRTNGRQGRTKSRRRRTNRTLLSREDNKRTRRQGNQKHDGQQWKDMSSKTCRYRNGNKNSLRAAPDKHTSPANNQPKGSRNR